jgi:hypothetical protein
MSAFILSDLHFSTIAYYLEGYNENLNPQELANKLKSINIESVNYRYDEKTRKTKCKLTRDSQMQYTVSDIIRLIDCWDYQSCENPNNIEYHIMKGFLYSHFTEQQISDSKYESDKWSI